MGIGRRLAMGIGAGEDLGKLFSTGKMRLGSTLGLLLFEGEEVLGDVRCSLLLGFLTIGVGGGEDLGKLFSTGK
jgi:hypothetical protein